MEIYKRVNELLGTEYKNDESIDWVCISKDQKLSEDFIREFQDKIDWVCISKYQKLSGDLIKEFHDRVNWQLISIYQKLPENIIKEFIKDNVDWWRYISIHQKLSEDFIREFRDKVYWKDISAHQKLSECFIREFQNKVSWGYISTHQKLSEDFIRKFQNKVNWCYISIYQKLSEDFIREFQDKVDWYYISIYQKLSDGFMSEFTNKLNRKLINNSWHYKNVKYKKRAVIKTGLYECHDDYFIAYKGIRSDRYSKFNFIYKYEPGNIYESWCDCSDNVNGHGLSVWTKGGAINYCSELVVKVKVRYEDVGRVVHDGGKVRCFKIEVLD